jgi:hypothetical protein
VALAARADEALCLELLRCLERFAEGIGQSREAPMRADLRGGLGVLKELYDAGPSEEVRYAVELATVRDPDSYARLGAACGPVLSILRAADPARYTRPEQRSLLFECAYHNTGEAAVRPVVVLVNSATRQRFELPSALELRGHATGGGSGSVVLPAGLPAGRYRVFLEVRAADRVISVGHSFEADL